MDKTLCLSTGGNENDDINSNNIILTINGTKSYVPAFYQHKTTITIKTS